MKRTIHYEAAFESFLRERGTPYVAVDEAKRALFGGVSLKSFDFVVYSGSGVNLLVDVKGRKFPYVTRGQHRYWENWVDDEDLRNLSTWEEVFGRDFQGMLVFTYALGDPRHAASFTDVHSFRDELYAFVGLPAELYARHSRRRSPSWQTVHMPTGLFRELLAPVSAYL